MSVSNDVMEDLENPSFLHRLKAVDWAWALLVVAGAVAAYLRFHAGLGVYEEATLAGTTAGLIALGWYWRPMQAFSVVVAALSLYGIALYGDTLASAHRDPLLAWLLSSPAAIAWSCGLFLAATLAYLSGLSARSDAFSERALRWGSRLTWAAATLGFVALMVRWRESYLVGPAAAGIPVSDLFDVFVLFNVVTALLYLYFETRYRQRALGALALLIVSAAALFTFYLMFEYHGARIGPVNPELRSYWIKIHVPALFIGYGALAMGAMVGAAYLLRLRAERLRPDGRVARRLPNFETLDDVMYRYNALGFALLTLGTILGALWAEQAWGAYWSWDPKETEALVVWLNYAAWLHMRYTKGWRGKPMAWWTLIGLLLTTAGFIGVDVFLPGLHSFGKL